MLLRLSHGRCVLSFPVFKITQIFKYKLDIETITVVRKSVKFVVSFRISSLMAAKTVIDSLLNDVLHHAYVMHKACKRMHVGDRGSRRSAVEGSGGLQRVVGERWTREVPGCSFR